jgi:hypothetical protein
VTSNVFPHPSHTGSSVEVVVSGTLAQQKAAEPGYETEPELTIEVEAICVR